MKSDEALRKLADVTASQWGMVTTAQASALGVTRLNLSRLSESGHLERLANGVYRDAGAPGDEFEDLRAAWLSTEPKLLAEDRLRNLSDGVVVASSSAALLHGIGDLWASRHEFVSAKRRQTQRVEIRYRLRRLEDRDITLVEGIPAMTLERTLADLLEDVGDLSLVADALGAAVKKQSLDFKRLRELFSPLAERHGFRRHDGIAVLDRLLEVAGLDLDAVARRISGYPALGSRVFASYLKHAMPKIDVSVLKSQIPSLESLTSEVSDLSGQAFRDALLPQLGEIVSKIVADSAAPSFGKATEELINTPALTNLSQQWAKALANSFGSAVARDAVPIERNAVPIASEADDDDQA
ncbi:MAG: type IV toxin-antitoxin system AbiEi family antitoxin domain-containing protein [Ancrocorticia sp.]|uniref:type IV toxin-antitoxin system AbiEi family antitoxin domain-containing protein n=1 Tax=Ancrocorticia sp. TaxID=2593684 RepID=UPI003F927446